MSLALEQQSSGFRPGMTLDRVIAPWKEPLDDALLGSSWYGDGTSEAATALQALAASRVAIGPITDAPSILAKVAPWVRPSQQLNAHAHQLLATLDERLPLEAPPVELLPYVLDPHAVGTRLRVLREGDRAHARQQRKATGAFFTPPDLADHMVDLALRDNFEAGIVLDPACGSGVFLAAAMRWFVANASESGSATLLRLRGVDIDRRCITAGRLVLAAQAAALDFGELLEYWDETEKCFAVADAFDEEVMPHQVAAVVMNPPYGPTGKQLDLAQVDSVLDLGAPLSAGTPMYAPFVALGLQVAKTSGARLIAVVPLAIACNTTRPFPALRSLLDAAGGGLRFSFFDRTPDSIFGDHVKTRACVLEWDPSGDDLQVTSLTRWSSAGRHRLFDDLVHVPLDRAAGITDGIPRLGTPAEAQTFGRLRECWGSIPCMIGKISRVEVESDERQVYVAGTGYNWLTVLRSAEVVRSSDSMSPVHALTFISSEHADAAFAVLSSRITYWQWSCTSDAFHITRRFLAEAPWPTDLSDLESLASLGRELSFRVLDRPVISVNKGRTTVSFDPESQSELRDAVDVTLGNALGLEPDFTLGLRPWLASHIDAGRTSKEVPV
ncbi:MAG: N-6 DNA methylase [Actinomycetes bacterium]